MQPEPITLAHELFHWLLDHWKLVLLALGTAGGGFVWWLRQVFVTHKTMNLCKEDLTDELEKHRLAEEKFRDAEEARRLEDKRDNAADHDELKSGITWIKNHLIERNHD